MPNDRRAWVPGMVLRTVIGAMPCGYCAECNVPRDFKFKPNDRRARMPGDGSSHRDRRNALRLLRPTLLRNAGVVRGSYLMEVDSTPARRPSEAASPPRSSPPDRSERAFGARCPRRFFGE